jgi:hypothetical protein
MAKFTLFFTEEIFSRNVNLEAALQVGILSDRPNRPSLKSALPLFHVFFQTLELQP